MRYFVLICFLLVAGFDLAGQDINANDEGTVSYITSQNVYVKFKSTKQISVGDTLFVSRDGKLIPALKVSNLSSISCVCIPISAMKFKVNDNLISKPKLTTTKVPDIKNKEIAALPIIVVPSTETVSTTDSTNDGKKKNKQKIGGRLSLAS